MQNRSMGEGRVGGAREWGGGMKIPSTYVFRQDRNSSVSILRGGDGREKPWQNFGAYRKEGEAECQSKGGDEWGQGWAVLQQAEQ